MADWDINKPLGVCCGTDREIGKGEEYVAALIETEEGLLRRDFSSDYWKQSQPEVFCYWKTRLPDPQDKRPVFIDDEMLMAFFERLANETQEERISFRFVIALILMRKRKLKYESVEKKDEHEIWKLKVTGRNEIVDVVNPHLDEDRIEELSSQLGQILHADL